MLTVPNIESGTSLLGELVSDRGRKPETEGFDFFSYLLGLQTTFTGDQVQLDPSTVVEQTSEAIPVATEPMKDQPLLNLFSTSPELNQVLPEKTINTAQLAQTEIGKLDAKIGEKPDLVSSVVSKEQELKGSELLNLRSSPTGKDAPTIDAKITQLQVWNELPKHAVGTSTAQQLQTHELLSAPTEVKSDAGNAVLAKKVTGQYGQVAHPFAQMARPKEEVVVRDVEQSAAPKVTEKLVSSEPSERKSKGRTDSMVFSGLESAIQTESAKTQANISGMSEKPMDTPLSLPQLRQPIESLVNQGGGQMTVQLTPPDLGEVEIQVTSRGKRVEVQMTSKNEFTKSLLEGQVSELRHALESQELVVSKLNVQVARTSEVHPADNSFLAMTQNGHSFGNKAETSQQWDQSSSNSNRREVQAIAGSSSRLASLVSTPSFVPTKVQGHVDLRI